MQSAKQLSFLPKLNCNNTQKTEHGGSLQKGKRKTARPFHHRLAMHVVLKSSRARGKLSLLHPLHKNRIEQTVSLLSKHYRVRIYRFANVGNHLHLLLQAPDKKSFQNFLRALSGTIARLITGAKKGLPRKFWDHLAYSRLVTWGREYTTVLRYLIRNLIEAELGLKRDRSAKIYTLGNSLRPVGKTTNWTTNWTTD